MGLLETSVFVWFVCLVSKMVCASLGSVTGVWRIWWAVGGAEIINDSTLTVRWAVIADEGPTLSVISFIMPAMVESITPRLRATHLRKKVGATVRYSISLLVLLCHPC